MEKMSQKRIDQLVKLDKLNMEPILKSLFASFNPRQRMKKIKEEIKDGAGFIFFESDSIIVAYIEYMPLDKNCYGILSIQIHPEYRNGSVLRQLFRKAYHEMKSLRDVSFVSSVHINDSLSLKLHEKLGFKKVLESDGRVDFEVHGDVLVENLKKYSGITKNTAMINLNWNVAGLILEGISGTGKTTILQELVKARRFVSRDYPSSFILSEHHTQRVLEKKEHETGLKPEDNIALLDSHVSTVEMLDSRMKTMGWYKRGTVAMRIPYVFERFHLSHINHYHHLKWRHIRDVDERLAHLNCGICLLVMDEASIRERTLKRDNLEWGKYIKKVGDKDEKVIKYFMQQQEKLLELTRKSSLPSYVINTSRMSVKETVEIILDNWGIIR